MAEAGGEPTDSDIEAVLRSVPEEQWMAIWAAHREVSGEPDHLRWEGGQHVRVVDGEVQPVLQMPHAVYSDAVERLRYALGALVVPFAWPQWEGIRRHRGGHGIAEAPVTDAVRLITAVLRSERFTDGSIGGAIEDGTLPGAIERVRRWYEGRADGAD